MISSSKRLNRISRKWQKMTAVGRKRISLPGGINESMVAEKGHFVIYTTDQKRHVVPMSFLSNKIFVERLKLSEEEFGLSSHDPTMLPCDSALFEYIVFIVQRGLDRRHEKALRSSISPGQYSLCTSLHQERTAQKSLVCGC